MAKKQQARQTHRNTKPNVASSLDPSKAQLESQLLDAVSEIVHQGYGDEFNIGEVWDSLSGWKPNCIGNYEYVFSWNSHFDFDSLRVNWKRPNQQILRSVINRTGRLEKILNGSPLTKKEQQSYRLELARQKHGYFSAQQNLKSNFDCKWINLSYLTDSKGRSIYILEMGDADTTTEEEMDSMSPRKFIEWHEEVWNWTDQDNMERYGLFTSQIEAEVWMATNGAFSLS